MSRHIAVGSALIAAAALFAAGCGSDGSNSANNATTQPAKKTAKSINSPFMFTVQGSEVTVAVTGKQATPVRDLQAQVVCANLAAKGFADRNEATTTWKKAATSVSVTLPKSADGQDLCAISFPTLKKQAVAFFNEEAKKRYLEDAEAVK
jgi:hypothetical protein